MEDAAASCARFLAGNGWRRDLSLAERRRVLWQYNRSDAYIDTVLALQSPGSTSLKAAGLRRSLMSFKRLLIGW
jgi:membrane-bound lytic murein transglycosylase B